MLFKDILVFRDDLYFDGAVQADWFYQPDRVSLVASNFVFHGPSTHAVVRNEVGSRNLIDTASFALHLAQKMSDPEQGSPFTLAIAGYGTGKSHLAVALSALFSGEEWDPELHRRILDNVRRADSGIADQLEKRVKKPRLVLTINGMRDFNLHYELLRTAEKALDCNHLDRSILSKLDRRREVAQHFIEHSYELLKSTFHIEAEKKGLTSENDVLKNELLVELSDPDSKAFEIVNQVYTGFNGHPIRMDEGVSANAIIEVLLKETCGLHGKFDGIVILFDEFGRFLEYAGANPAAAGDSALQQIFEVVQNAQGDVQFVGFIQSDIKTYLQRVDKTSNISRYIDRYDASEKIYLSTNLETVFANLLEHPDPNTYQRYVLSQLHKNEETWKKLHVDMTCWLPLKGIWTQWSDFSRIIINAIYPLHPLSTYLLCQLTDWLQSRSSLTLLSEKVRQMSMAVISEDGILPMIYPVDLIKGSFFAELLNAEEQGRQRSQFCILVNNILRKFETKLSQDEINLLLSNLILRICRFHFEKRSQLIHALSICGNLSDVQVQSALRLLEDEYAVLSFDDRLICFDFVADSVGASDFRKFLNAAKNRTSFDPRLISLETIQNCAGLADPMAANFSIERGIMTKEWAFSQRLIPIGDVNIGTIKSIVDQLKQSTEPDQEKGLLLWVYAEKNTPQIQLDNLSAMVCEHVKEYALVVFLLDDAENRLQDAILNYLILRDMGEDDQGRYHRFYGDALTKAEERLQAEFFDLKQERKRVLGEGIVSIDKRMGVYLTQVLAEIYPKVVPFDFDGFQNKSIAKARKQFCAIMKWILMEHLSYPSLKSQPVEIKGRVESMLAGRGIHSWRCLNEHYQAVIPMNGAVRTIYQEIEKQLREQGFLDLKRVIGTLNAPPYGLNDYAAFLLIGLLCENLSYTTRLEYKGERQNSDRWAEAVVSDSKISMKVLTETRIILIDTEKTGDRFRQLFRLINNTIDLAQVPVLAAQMETLEAEENIPDELQSDYALARMRLDEGLKGVEEFKRKTGEIKFKFSEAKEEKDAYKAMQVALQARRIAGSPASTNDSFRYNDNQLQWLGQVYKKALLLAEKAFDVWMPKQRCMEVGRLKNYEKHIKNCIDLMRQLGFERQAQKLRSIADKEVDHLNILIARQSLRENGENFLRTSIITRGITMKALMTMAEQGEALLKVYHGFDFASIPQLKSQHDCIEERVVEIRNAYAQQEEELKAVWDRISSMTTIQDMRLINRQIHSLLESGLTDQDRANFEGVCRIMDGFIQDIEGTEKFSEDPERFHNIVAAIREKYNKGSEINFDHILDVFEEEFNRSVAELEKEWCKKYLLYDISDAQIEALVQWKIETAILPKYLSSVARNTYKTLLEKINLVLTEKKIAYIELLFDDLTEREKEMCLHRLNKMRKIDDTIS